MNFLFKDIIETKEKIFDYVIITVKDNFQKKYLEDYIGTNINKLPNSKYIVITNHMEKCNGTGSALLDALSYLKKKFSSFNYKVLLINSGGLSSRIPQFSKYGKLFIPIPTDENKNLIMFDKIIEYNFILGRNLKTGGILISTSDVICNFSYFDDPVIESTAFTIKVSKEKGLNHGVFVKDEDSFINKFLHKKSLDILRKNKALIGDSLYIDTGLYFLTSDILNYIYNKYRAKIYKEKLDFYDEIVPEILEKNNIKLCELKNSSFIHLGTNEELFNYYFNGCNQPKIINSIVSSKIKLNNKIFISNSNINDNVKIGDNVLIFDSILTDINIPSNKVVYTNQNKLIILDKDNLDDKSIIEIDEYIKNKEVVTKLSSCRNNYLKKIKPIDFNKINILNDEAMVCLPVRINLSAGWNDTPPYCNENKGSVLNMSLQLDKKNPIKATMTKLNKKVIILESIDENKLQVIDNIDDILMCDNPKFDLCLLKASLVASGLIYFSKNCKLETILNKIGGFKLRTETTNIPLGSGLGTSSILIEAIIKAIYDYLGLHISNYDLYVRVACCEQIMNTGGGFQDQIGAYEDGIKLIEFIPTNKFLPEIVSTKVLLDKEIKDYLDRNLKLIYTGKTRLAANLLKQVMGNYVLNDKKTIDILRKIDLIARDMKTNLENKNLELFGKNMIKSYNLCKMMYKSFTNEQIENEIEKIKDNVYGYMLAGAGGGGYLVVLYKEKKKGVIGDEKNV